MKLLIQTLLITSLFTVAAKAGELTPVKDATMDEAAMIVSDKGRMEWDSGSVHEVAIYKNEAGLSTFQIVREIMIMDRVIARKACPDFEYTNACVRKVLEGDEEVKANYQVDNMFEFIAELKTWAPQDYMWNEALNYMESTSKEHLSEDFRYYSYGYDYVADVWTTVFISKDRKTVVVMSADVGA